MGKSIARPDYITYVEVCGVEFNDAHVWVDSSPAEPDVNWHGSFEITGVERNGEDIEPVDFVKVAGALFHGAPPPLARPRRPTAPAH